MFNIKPFYDSTIPAYLLYFHKILIFQMETLKEQIISEYGFKRVIFQILFLFFNFFIIKNLSAFTGASLP